MPTKSMVNKKKKKDFKSIQLVRTPYEKCYSLEKYMQTISCSNGCFTGCMECGNVLLKPHFGRINIIQFRQKELCYVAQMATYASLHYLLTY